MKTDSGISLVVLVVEEVRSRMPCGQKKRERERNKQIVTEDFNTLLSIIDTCKSKISKDIED